MANKNLTDTPAWSTPQAPTPGDGARGSTAEACFQGPANRTKWLRDRCEAPVSGSADDGYANIDSSITGDTAWHDSTTITKTVNGDIGQTINLLLLTDVLQNSSGGNGTTFRLKSVDNGVTSYVDGCAQVVAADGLTSRVMLGGKHTLASTTVVFTLQLKQSNAAVSSQLCGGWNFMTW